MHPYNKIFQRILENRLVKIATKSIVVRVIAVLSILGLNLAVALQFESKDAGRFFLIVAAIQVISIFGRLGVDHLLLRELSRSDKGISQISFQGLQLSQLRLVHVSIFSIISTHIVILILTIFGMIAMRQYGGPALIKDMSLSMFITAHLCGVMNSVIVLFGNILRTKNFVVLHVVLGSIVLNGISMMFLLLFDLSLLLILAAYTFSHCVSLGLLFFVVRVVILREHVMDSKATENFDITYCIFNLACHSLQALRQSIHFFITSLVNRGVLLWLPIIVVGTFFSLESAAVFGFLSRVSNSVSTFTNAVVLQIAPSFVKKTTSHENVEKESHKNLAISLMIVLFMSVSTAICVLIVAGYFRVPALEMLHENLTLLTLLLAVQVVSSATITIQLFQNMRGRDAIISGVNLLTLAVFVSTLILTKSGQSNDTLASILLAVCFFQFLASAASLKYTRLESKNLSI